MLNLCYEVVNFHKKCFNECVSIFQEVHKVVYQQKLCKLCFFLPIYQVLCYEVTANVGYIDLLPLLTIININCQLLWQYTDAILIGSAFA